MHLLKLGNQTKIKHEIITERKISEPPQSPKSSIDYRDIEKYVISKLEYYSFFSFIVQICTSLVHVS